jgi:cellulose synthase/poly-beta-1,6-N-acetylglucosamine synthase-like glycosyltransferase
MTVTAFWVGVGVLTYVYLGYPLLVRVLAAIHPRAVRQTAGTRPTVTVVITAYNEQASIREKLQNVLSLSYPSSLLDVTVVSDASSDDTDRLVLSCGFRNVKLLRVEGRQGKTACQNAAVGGTTAEIVVFTDATTRIHSGALIALVENFSDADVGCVAGLLVYQGERGNLTAAGGASYWGYEVALRRAESDLSTLIGVSGCLYAVRRSAYRPISPNVISDFVIAMRMREQSLRTVLEPRAICFEDTLCRSKQELSMRVRVAVRSIGALVAERRFLNVIRDPVFAWQLWSHKLLRYASPYWMLIVMISSAALIRKPFYRGVLIAELVLLAAGLLGCILQVSAKGAGLLSKPYYFLLTNVASIIATLRYVKGERMVTWKPIR